MKSLAEKLRFQRVLIRADGSSSIGLGHVVRSFALARELHDLGVEVEVWGSTASDAKALAQSFQPVQSRELPAPIGSAAQLDEVLSFNPDLVVADGYHFEKEFFEGLEKREIPYGVIDDNGETQASQPLFVVNQNPSAAQNQYPEKFPEAELFLGLNFVLVRQEVARAVAAALPVKDSVLVSMGGTDIRNLTGVVSGCLATAGFDVVASVPLSTKEDSTGFGETPSEVTRISPRNLLEAMAKSEIAVLAAGSTLWESHLIGNRIVALVVADNQLKPAESARQMQVVDAVIDVRSQRSMAAICEEIMLAVNELSLSTRIQGQPARCDGARRVATWIRDSGRLEVRTTF